MEDKIKHELEGMEEDTLYAFEDIYNDYMNGSCLSIQS